MQTKLQKKFWRVLFQSQMNKRTCFSSISCTQALNATYNPAAFLQHCLGCEGPVHSHPVMPLSNA